MISNHKKEMLQSATIVEEYTYITYKVLDSVLKMIMEHIEPQLEE